MFVFAGLITFTVTQADVPKKRENFLNLYYKALTQTSSNQVVSGRSGVENFLSNLGEFESNNYNLNNVDPNLLPEIDDSYPGNIEDGNFEVPDSIFPDNFQDGSFSEEDSLNSLNQNSLNNMGSNSSNSSSNSFSINNPLTGFSSGDYDIDGYFFFINNSISSSVIPDINIYEYNMLPHILDSLSPFEKMLIDYPFLSESTVNYGTSYILAWVCLCIVLLAAVFITIGRSQISESLKDNSEEDSNLDKKEKLNISA